MSKEVEVTLELSTSGVEISVRDFGPGFSVDDIPDPTDPANLLKASGRGIFFMQTFMDVVEWSNHTGGGTVVKMTKRNIIV